ncbi:MAG: L,D-transpeptidase [Verrucomicrobiota bacterium]
MKTIAMVVLVSVLVSLNAEAGWRKSHHKSKATYTQDAHGTLYLNRSAAPTRQAAPAPAPAVKPEKKGLFGGLFRKKSTETQPMGGAPIARQATPAPAPRPVTVRRAQVIEEPAPRKKKPGLFAKLFGKKEKKPEVPAQYRPNPVQAPVKVYNSVLAQSNRSNTKVVIDVSKQRAFLLVNGRVAMDSPVSTARPGKYTPRGTHYMGERVRTGKVSTIYHVGMPYWMRLGSSLYGVHAGYLPGYPASAGCVRMPMEAARMVFDNTRSGTAVSIQSNWGGYAAAMGRYDGEPGYRVAGL